MRVDLAEPRASRRAQLRGVVVLIGADERALESPELVEPIGRRAHAIASETLTEGGVDRDPSTSVRRAMSLDRVPKRVGVNVGARVLVVGRLGASQSRANPKCQHCSSDDELALHLQIQLTAADNSFSPFVRLVEPVRRADARPTRNRQGSAEVLTFPPTRPG